MGRRLIANEAQTGKSHGDGLACTDIDENLHPAAPAGTEYTRSDSTLATLHKWAEAMGRKLDVE